MPLFVNRCRDKLKVLYWDGDGVAIWYRRLEQEKFQMPTISDGASPRSHPTFTDGLRSTRENACRG
jgi:transposase